MTIRSYYGDSYRWEFDATVLEVLDESGAPRVVLDASYFYPTSGGQPHDTGTLGNANVMDVSIRASDGALLHHVDAPVAIGPTNATIHGARRFDHMQQHSGQHILSQAFIRVANATTIGFHLADTVSIDLDAPALSDATIADATEVANQLLAANVAVRAWFPSAEELADITLRKMPDVDGPVRIVAIGDFDISACGGTHVARAGEVGLLSVVRTERMKRGTRIEFMAGHRARADYARKHAIVQQLSAALTCAPAELPDAVARQANTIADTRRALVAYRERDLDDEALALAAQATQHGAVKVVRATWTGRAIDEVKGLALRLTTEADTVVLFGVDGARVQLVFARSENVTLDLKPAFDRALAALGGGKGGGGRILMGSASSMGAAALEEVLGNVELPS
ncbi:MAG: alanyl-tRNA editing protein [bacterium]